MALDDLADVARIATRTHPAYGQPRRRVEPNRAVGVVFWTGFCVTASAVGSFLILVAAPDHLGNLSRVAQAGAVLVVMGVLGWFAALYQMVQYGRNGRHGDAGRREELRQLRRMGPDSSGTIDVHGGVPHGQPAGRPGSEEATLGPDES